MRILCLVDAPVIPPDRWIWNYLPDYAQADKIDFMHVQTRDLFPKWGKLLSYYPAYLQLAIKALKQSRKVDYDLIVAWESKNGFPLAILRSLLGIETPKLVILAFAYKGVALNFVRLGHSAMQKVDHITVPTTDEIKYYHQLLGFPLDRITFSPLGWYDRVVAPELLRRPTRNYVFAGGRTGRDYETLFKAIGDLNIQLIVNTRRFAVKGLTCPPNVEINESMSADQYHAVMAGAKFGIVPLEATESAAGLLHIIALMSLGKAVIATRMPGTTDYVEDGQTGFLVPPYDVKEMHSAISYLLSHPQVAAEMGQKARQRYEEKFSFSAFAKRTYDVLQNVLATGAQQNKVKPNNLLT